LQSLLPGSKVANLNIDLEGVSVIRARGRPKKHQDGTGRVQHHRAKRQVEINRLSAIMNSDPSGGTNEEFTRYWTLVNESCNENPIKEGTGKPVTEKAFGSIFISNYATHPTYIVTDVTVDTFIQALKKQHRDFLPAKEENHLFCPSLFNPDLCSESDRGLANVVYANGVWLDFDYGHLTHRDLANIFPTFRLVAFNTFSSTKDQPRFRVYTLVAISRAVAPTAS